MAKLINIIIIIAYLLIGCVVLGVSVFLNDNCKSFNKISNNTFYETLFDVNRDAFPGICVLYAAFWPLFIIMAVLVYPFATIKFLSNNNWSWKINKETNN